MMFRLMLGTGIRLGSLVCLDISNVDLNAGTLTVRGKGRAEQLFFLDPTLRGELRRHLKELDAGSQALFHTHTGRRLQARQIQFRFKKWLQEAGISQPYTVHALRHTFATRLYNQTGDLRLVQRALGHKRASTTEIYTQVTDVQLRKAIESLDEIT
jgi:site-specific recombinase XerD